jgi:hypothetical protein
MKGRPIDATIVSFQHKLDNDIGLAEEFRLAGCADTVHATGARCDVLFPQSRNVPHSNGLIKRRRNDQILRRVELRTHDIMIVTSQNIDAISRLPVPNADCLVVRTGDDPGILIVKKRRANVIQMAQQCE